MVMLLGGDLHDSGAASHLVWSAIVATSCAGDRRNDDEHLLQRPPVGKLESGCVAQVIVLRLISTH